MKQALTAIVVVAAVSVGVFALGAAENYTYDDNIKSIIQQNGCADCHTFAQSYNELLSFKSTTPLTRNVPIVNPAKPDSSVIVWRIEGKLPDGGTLTMMPMGGSQLSDTVIATVRDWISQGAPEKALAVDDTRSWGEIKSMFEER